MLIVERDLTEAEYQQMIDGFVQHAAEHGNPKDTSERLGFVAMDGDWFIGCASGLAYPKVEGYGDWFQLTDLFVDKEHRGRGVGKDLLLRLEERVRGLGIGHVWTWTAGFEGPGFYESLGYEVFLEMGNWYTTGDARVGMFKELNRG